MINFKQNLINKKYFGLLDSYNFKEEDWSNLNNNNSYIESKYKIGSEKWKRNRVYRIPSGNAYKVLEKDPNELVKEFIENNKNTYFMDIDSSQHGIVNEPEAIKKYKKYYKLVFGIDLVVEEKNTCIPKWNPMISTTPDGIVKQNEKIISNIEIKSPKKFPHKISFLLKKLEYHEIDGNKVYFNFSCRNKNHIFSSTYSQIQQSLLILNLKYCDYIIDCENIFYVERIYFDKNFIKNYYSKLLLLEKVMDENVEKMCEKIKKDFSVEQNSVEQNSVEQNSVDQILNVNI